MIEVVKFKLGTLYISLSIKSILEFYLVWFLAVDVINGLFLKVMDLGEVISFGQFARLAILLLLNFYFFFTNRKYAAYIFIGYLYFGFCLFSYWQLNEFKLSFLSKEIIYFTKLITYPLIFLYAYSSVRDERIIRRMVDVTFWIFAGSIFVTFITGSGLGGYDQYNASKGFFYATNATAILGLSLGAYYLFHNRNMLYSFMVLVVLFMSGSKVFLVFGGLIAVHFFLDFIKGIRTAKSSVFLYTILMFMILIASGVVYQKIWVERYKVRVESVLINAERAGLFKKMDFFSYYAFISYERAVNAKEAFRVLNENPKYYITGLGHYYTKYEIFSESRFGKDDIESDFFDMLIMYGALGLGLFMVFHVYIILNIESSIVMLGVVVFLYSMIAGHLVVNPMAYTLPAVIFGFYLRREMKSLRDDSIT